MKKTGHRGPYVDVRWSPRQEMALVVATKAHDMVEVHRVLAHPSEEITKEEAQAMDDGPVRVLGSTLAGERETAGDAGG